MATMKNIQNVSYRTCDAEFLRLLASLPKSVGNLLLAMLDEVDNQDNCVQVDMADIRKAHKLDKDNTSRRLARLKKEGIVKEVEDIHGIERLMINPALVWSTGRDKLRFAINMFELGSHAAAWRHSKLERELVGSIDTQTGELVSEYQERHDELIRALADAMNRAAEEALQAA
ncbi:hypothetical protein [Chromohalobacter canadensis]|uniref:hypothetical protein n=1 Tax=Chromohalobacter canadensis TaxID=141389 RepID=UPI00240ED384|nr:hypothetical protein [Chromohalobacter canadensis]